MATEKKGEEKKHSITKESYKSAKKSTQLLNKKQFGKKLEKGSLRREKGALQHPKQNRTEQH